MSPRQASTPKQKNINLANMDDHPLEEKVFTFNLLTGIVFAECSCAYETPTAEEEELMLAPKIFRVPASEDVPRSIGLEKPLARRWWNRLCAHF